MSDNDRQKIIIALIVAAVICVFAFELAAVYFSHYQAVTIDKLEDILMWVKDTPELQSHACELGADGEFDNWDYNRLQQLHSELRYDGYVKQLATCD